VILFSVLLFFIEFLCVNTLKNKSEQRLWDDNEILNALLEAIRYTDVNHYITYIMIYASLIYLGLFYATLLYLIILLQGISVSLMLLLMARGNKKS